MVRPQYNVGVVQNITGLLFGSSGTDWIITKGSIRLADIRIRNPKILEYEETYFETIFVDDPVLILFRMCFMSVIVTLAV